MYLKTLFLTTLLTVAPMASAKSTTAHVDGVLGTSFDITLYGTSEQKAHAAINSLLTHIEAQENLLSTWRRDSEISRLNRIHQLNQASQPLLDVLSLCHDWETKSKQHFSCRMGTINKAWQRAVHTQEVPDRIAMRRLARDIIKTPFPAINANSKLTTQTHIRYDISAIAKGYILDDAISFIRTQLPAVTGIKINIGGDIVLWGEKSSQQPWQIAINDHKQLSDNTSGNTLAVTQGAVAHSGIGERDYTIQRKQFSHILAPKEGWPIDFPHSVTVYAPDATTADAAATMLSNMDIAQALNWVNQQPAIEALFQTTNKQKYWSDNWKNLIGNQQTVSPTKLTIDYQIPRFDDSDYERPYLAIWLTDTDNNFVRQLLLLGRSNRWAQENKRWWRYVGRNNETILDAIAKPTRRPGHYQVSWDGLDSSHQLSQHDKLIVHIEVSREHGGHDYQRTSIDLSTDDSKRLSAKGELGKTKITITR